MYKSTLAIGCIMISTAVLGGCVSTPKQESTGQFVDSSAITVKVKSKLFSNKQVKSLPINVSTYKGNVQLSGFVDDEYQKQKAASLAASVEGVTSVRNALVVKPVQ